MKSYSEQYYDSLSATEMTYIASLSLTFLNYLIFILNLLKTFPNIFYSDIQLFYFLYQKIVL